MQAILTTQVFEGNREYLLNMTPNILYAFSDDFTILLTMPFVVRHRINHHHTSGPGDFIVELEYDIYTKEHYTYYDQITIVANTSIPTGSAKKNPPTGIGANSFFLGATLSRMGINWFYFTSYGEILKASSHRTRFGNEFLYQYGIGRRIFSNSEWLLAWLLEFDGDYTLQDIVKGKINPNSGGNIIYATPSLFLSSNESLVMHLGMGFPIYQRLNGHQPKQNYLVTLHLAWLF